MEHNYVLTMDIPETLARKYGVWQALENRWLNEALDNLQERFIVRFQREILDCAPLIVRVTNVMAVQISDAVDKMKAKVGNQLVVGLDKIYDPRADFYLEITRETNPLKPNESVVTNRFGALPIDAQFSALRRAVILRSAENEKAGIEDGGVIITDVGGFEGSTLKMLNLELSKRGIPISGVILGIMPEGNVDKVKELFGDRVQILNPTRMYEWVELRDFFLIDGRKAPDIYSEDGIRRYIPYTENLRGWASIRNERVDACVAMCKENYSATTELLRQIGVDVKRTIGEFVSINQAPPMKMRSTD